MITYWLIIDYFRLSIISIKYVLYTAIILLRFEVFYDFEAFYEFEELTEDEKKVLRFEEFLFEIKSTSIYLISEAFECISSQTLWLFFLLIFVFVFTSSIQFFTFRVHTFETPWRRAVLFIWTLPQMFLPGQLTFILRVTESEQNFCKRSLQIFFHAPRLSEKIFLG